MLLCATIGITHTGYSAEIFIYIILVDSPKFLVVIFIKCLFLHVSMYKKNQSRNWKK